MCRLSKIKDILGQNLDSTTSGHGIQTSRLPPRPISHVLSQPEQSPSVLTCILRQIMDAPASMLSTFRNMWGLPGMDQPGVRWILSFDGLESSTQVPPAGYHRFSLLVGFRA
ncbi:hypothetical protein FIBSPDRAFT_507747 [Athelia psychrophila]|uniref:Uncharacterized protein n=1 Tax=Athelia psychrophila TaxID=1759441 RepID=A0A166K3M4_9AGAM|nr:hypothetical protein FIBSPDRAFT_507747 [Fibularhizoctonia sp. CBS 109695]